MKFILELLKVLVLGVVEGITEWLPISSTGHMILIDEFIKLDCSDAFKDIFFVVIQLGAFAAVALRYFKRLYPFDSKLSKNKQKEIWDLWIKIIIGCIPAGVVGILLDDLIPNSVLIIAIALIVYGVLYILIESNNKKEIKIKKVKNMTVLDAFKVGLFQTLAVVPGTSRSGSTILGSLLMGISRPAAVEFSFFLALPVVAGQSFIKILKYGFVFTLDEIAIMVFGSIVAFVTSVLVIRFILDYVKNHDFKSFGIYRIVLGLLVLIYFYVLKK